VNFRDPSGLIWTDYVPGTGWLYIQLEGKYLNIQDMGTYDLTESRVEQEARDLFNRLSDPNVEPEGEFDTSFWDNFDQQTNWCYDNKLYKGNEVNYLGIGMYEAYKGRNDPTPIVYLWKGYHYFGTPSEGALYWAQKGQRYYEYFKQTGMRDKMPNGYSSLSNPTSRR